MKANFKEPLTTNKSPTTYNKPLQSILKYRHISADRMLLESPIVGQTGKNLAVPTTDFAQTRSFPDRLY